MELFFNRNGYGLAADACGTLADIVLASAHPDKRLRMTDADFANAIDAFVVERSK